jgi:hypothetical protein
MAIEARAPATTEWAQQQIGTTYTNANLHAPCWSGCCPRGALVCYREVSYGHVALSLGHGRAVITIGLARQGLPVAIEPYRWWFTARCVGWPPRRSRPGEGRPVDTTKATATILLSGPAGGVWAGTSWHVSELGDPGVSK